LFLSVLTALLPAQEQECRVEGQVLSIAGAPLKKATLTLQWSGQSNQSTPVNYLDSLFWSRNATSIRSESRQAGVLHVSSPKRPRMLPTSFRLPSAIIPI